MHQKIAELFNQLFELEYRTKLAGGFTEPFYRAPTGTELGLICYRESFASSALHEISHWCIAGSERMKLDDYGYWYSPDGRNSEQQKLFERVEVRPQAIECVFSEATGIKFTPSADNLAVEARCSYEFTTAIKCQANEYLQRGLPTRAERFLDALRLEFCDTASESENASLVN